MYYVKRRSMVLCVLFAIATTTTWPVAGAAQTDAESEAESTSTEGREGEDADTEEEGDGEAKDEEKQGLRIGLEEAVRSAKTNQDLLDEFEAKREQAEWKQYQARWARFPKIRSLTTVAPVPANADPDRFDRNVDEITAFNIGPFIQEDLDLIVPVYTFGRIKTLRELADVGVDVADLKKEEAQLNAVFQAKRAYYSLQLSRTFEPILAEGDERIKKKLDEMQEARDFGEADFETKDLRKLQIFSAEVETRISDNAKLEDISSSGLKYLADLEAERLAVGQIEDDGTPPGLADFQTYVQAARENRPDIRQLEHAVEARELQVQLERKNFFPNVFVAGKFGFGWSTKETKFQPVCRRDTEGGPCINTNQLDDESDLFARPDRDPLSRLSVGIALGMRWNIDLINQRGKLNERKAQFRALRAQRRRAMGAMKLQVREKYDDAYDYYQKIEINDRRLEAARRWRDQLGFSIETAGAEMEDAIKPLKAYYQAKAKYLEAKYRYLVARAALAQAVGVEWLNVVEPEQESAGEGDETGTKEQETSDSNE